MTDITLKNRLGYFLVTFTIVLGSLTTVGYLLTLAFGEKLVNEAEGAFGIPIKLLLLVLSPYAFMVASRAFKTQPNLNKLSFTLELVSTLSISIALALLLGARWYYYALLEAYMMPSLEISVWGRVFDTFPKSLEVLLQSFPLNLLSILLGLGLTTFIFKQLDKRLFSNPIQTPPNKYAPLFPIHFFIALFSSLFLLGVVMRWGFLALDQSSFITASPDESFVEEKPHSYIAVVLLPYCLAMSIFAIFPKLIKNKTQHYVSIFSILLFAVICGVFFSSSLWFYHQFLDLQDIISNLDIARISTEDGLPVDPPIEPINYGAVFYNGLMETPKGLLQLFLSFPFNLLALTIVIPLSQLIIRQLQTNIQLADTDDNSIHLINDED
ncbi:MAG: hypothetical protein GY810_03890 [Aureispira sp.]|nr:hypothetical protein [Aureispira sp.]